MISFTKTFGQGEKIVQELAEIYKGPPEHFAEAVKLIAEIPADADAQETPQEKEERIATMLSAFYMASTISQNYGIRKESNPSGEPE